MIVFDLECSEHHHRFEGWFASSDDFARQKDRGLLMCPQCGSAHVVKAPMAPRLTRKGNQIEAAVPASRAPAPAPTEQAPAASPPAFDSLPPQVQDKLRTAITAIATAQAEALKSSRWVGKRFAEDARAMHYGDAEQQAIHGQASPEEAQALADEGIEIAPILFPVAPPGEVN
ncbi:MAG TPA: DUF1178 family protein [Novosphingobium sp.]|nr:DUF1178 family protein [Novosphingobium sp.]